MGMTRKNVLWVDDEVEYLRSHIMFLETRGYRVTPVYSGEDAISLLAEDINRFDIVLLDEQMPGKGGLDTLVDIKELNSELPVVMVTKSEEESLMEEAIGRKIDGYLTKPVNPSQILIVCKNLLHSKNIVNEKLKNDFLRSYSKISNVIKSNLKYSMWIKVFKSIYVWDIKLQALNDEALRQAINELKTNAEVAFSEFISSNYMGWLGKNIADGKILSNFVMDTYVVPQVELGEKIVFFVMGSMRYDQYLVIRHLMRKYFTLNEFSHMSMLPTVPIYSKATLLSGLTPLGIEKKHNGIWRDVISGNKTEFDFYNMLLSEKLSKYGVSEEKILSIDIGPDDSSDNIMTKISSNEDADFIFINADFMELFFKGSVSDSSLVIDETDYRNKTISWFRESPFYSVMKFLSGTNYKVLFTTSNGANFCTRGIECYGYDEGKFNLRYQYGSDINSDERYALYIYAPEKFELPESIRGGKYTVLKENYYFAPHDFFDNYGEGYKNVFATGGLSMNEMIVPFVMLDPLGDIEVD